jgi:ADP-ribose pyrophosphatase YjhB (NUDIX family)
VEAAVMKRLLLQIWRYFPGWLQGMASALIRPRYQAAVAAVIFNEHGQLLLCEHTYRRKHPWGLPGGDLKFGEDPAEGVKRELYEETGLRAEGVRLLLVENSDVIHHIGLVYLCSGVSGRFVPNEEVASMRYFDLAALPEFPEMQRRTIDLILETLKNMRQASDELA